MYTAKLVTGSDAQGATYDERATRQFQELDVATRAVVQFAQGSVWDVFAEDGEHIARLHGDGTFTPLRQGEQIFRHKPRGV